MNRENSNLSQNEDIMEERPHDYDTQSELSLEMSEDHFSLDDEQNELALNKYHLELAIAKRIKQLRMETNNEIKRNLVMKICELRIILNQINDMNEQYNFSNGHKFITGEGSALICDICLKKPKFAHKLIKTSNVILACQYCGHQVHEKCQTNITRKCPKVLFEEKSNNVILKICPEIGLAAQEFKCADCKTGIVMEISHICDYDGRYYCTKCHWGDVDLSITPARVIHNWDFTPRPVSRQSLQIINYIKNKPVLFNIAELNSMLYGLVEELANLKKIRSELSQMMKYTRICKQPNRPKLTINNYLTDEEYVNSYSLNDLFNLRMLYKLLLDSHIILTKHIIKDCEVF